MAFKPYCAQCSTWHTEQEGHRPPMNNSATEAAAGKADIPSNHLSVMIEAVGRESAFKAKSALHAAGYCIYKGDPDTEIASLRERVKELESEREQWRESLAAPLRKLVIEYAGRAGHAEARAETAERERDEAREALKPFGIAASRALAGEGSPEDFLEEEHFRAARAITGED